MLKYLRRRRRGNAAAPPLFRGSFATWGEAQSICTGYDHPGILEKTRDAVARVRDGTAVYERDSVLFDRPERPYPLIACLLAAAHEFAGRLAVLDFGGSLGSTYFQSRPLLAGLKSVAWGIVEQPHYVQVGQREFTTDNLRFFASLDEASAAIRPNVLLLSGVLAYLPDPYDHLARMLAIGVRNVILDRTGFMVADRDQLAVQVVPPDVYDASYPAWFLGETRFRKTFARGGYYLAEEWIGSDGRHSIDGDEAVYKGFRFVHPGIPCP